MGNLPNHYFQVAHDVGLIAGNAFVAYMISGTRADDVLGTMFARDGEGTDRTCGSVACPLVNTVEIKLGPIANATNQTDVLVDVRNHMVLPCKFSKYHIVLCENVFEIKVSKKKVREKHSREKHFQKKKSFLEKYSSYKLAHLINLFLKSRS